MFEKITRESKKSTICPDYVKPTKIQVFLGYLKCYYPEYGESCIYSHECKNANHAYNCDMSNVGCNGLLEKG